MRRISPSLFTLVLLLAPLLAQSADAVLDADWLHYKARFLSAEGRVIDSGNQGISHSEGQGFGMLLAVGFNDREAFDRLWDWPRRQLRVRQDGLCAWRWEPGKGVTDRNNATDGDLLMAWALWQAAQRWGDATYATEAKAIAAALRTQVVKVTQHGTILLPGVDGFEHDGVATVNLSYWVFPALQAMHQIDPDPAWPALIDSGLRLIQHARFGRWGLPPDWLRLSDPLQPDPDHPARFGYDAIRIPLYLAWARLGTEERLAPFRAYLYHFHGAGFLSPWTDLKDDTISSWDAARGIHAVLALAAAQPLPSIDPKDDYYPASLSLLARLARQP